MQFYTWKTLQRLSRIIDTCLTSIKTLTCGVFLQADVKKNKKNPLRWCLKRTNTKGEKSPECHSVCVCKHQGMSEGPEEWFLGRGRKFQAQLLSISKVLFSPSCPRCPASQQRRSVAQHTKWDVTCAAILFYLYWTGRHWGRNAKTRSPAAWWGLVALQVHGGGCVIFTLTSEGGRETSPLLNNFSLPPGRPRPPFPQRQRKTVDNYLVWNFLAVSVSITTMRVSQNSYLWFWGHATKLVCC